MTIQLGYETENKFVIDATTIRNFKFIKGRRKLRENKVTVLTKMLLAGEHFESPIVVSINGSDSVTDANKDIIDGMHRITAIRKAIDQDPTFSIEVLLIYYRNLSRKKTKEIYSAWNIGTTQSADDFTILYADEIPILKEMKKDFPCDHSIYKEKGSIHFKLLTGSYLAAKHRKEGGYSGSRTLFVDQVMTLKKSDYLFLKRFMSEYLQNVSSALDKTDLYINTSPFAAIMYLYYYNVFKGNISSSDFWTRFKTKVPGNSSITQMSYAGGITATKMVMDLMIAEMNRVPSNQRVLRVPVPKDDDVEDDE
jgi:hypothetical protein